MKKTLFFLCILLYGIHHSQTYYSQDFNTPGLNGWTSTDLDGDTHQWLNINASSVNSNFGTGSLISFSYLNNTGTLTPDNLITSPLIDLSAVSAANAYLSYDLATYPSAPSEKYSIYITTSGTPGIITASTPVYTETVASGGYQKRSVNLTPFIGQQVYISFRHYDCSDQYYLIIDNIQVKTLPNKDAALKKVSLDRYGVVNTNYPIKATIRNNGTEAINNITLSWNDGTTDHSSTIPLATALATDQETTITHPIPVNYSSVTEKNINITITQVNGAADNTPANNSLMATFKIVSQNSPKKVLVEEGTGTWCGWCPRGAVAMDYMSTNYSNDFIGIAVHNGDPMQVDEYNTGANFSNFPAMNIDRVLIDQSVSKTDMIAHVDSRKSLIIPAQLDASSSFSGNSLTFNASATFRTNFSNANFRFAAILVEDGVSGTTSGYKQSNYYAGGNYGSMGGFESLPNPVPASQMTYDHVGRMLLGGYEGQAGSIPTTITDGQTVNYTFTSPISSAYDTSKIKIVLLLLDADTGEVVNARSFMLNTLGTNTAETNANYLTVYPNPATDYIKIQADHNVDITFYDTAGRIVLKKSDISPDSPISVTDMAKGTYFVSIKEKNKEPKTQKLIIK